MIRIPAMIFATVLATGMAIAAPLGGDKTYDMLFRDGTLDKIDRASALVYRREVSNALKPEADTRDTGDVTLSFLEGDKNVALLQFRQG